MRIDAMFMMLYSLAYFMNDAHDMLCRGALFRFHLLDTRI